jgi:hypothetical protein
MENVMPQGVHIHSKCLSGRDLNHTTLAVIRGLNHATPAGIRDHYATPTKIQGLNSATPAVTQALILPDSM